LLAPAPINRQTNLSSQSTELRSRLRSATFDNEASPIASAHRKPVPAPAISQHQPQLIPRAFDLARSFKRAEFPRLTLKQFGTAKPIDNEQPVGVR
jgi:hypothetical protein